MPERIGRIRVEQGPAIWECRPTAISTRAIVLWTILAHSCAACMRRLTAGGRTLGWRNAMCIAKSHADNAGRAICAEAGVITRLFIVGGRRATTLEAGFITASGPTFIYVPRRPIILRPAKREPNCS